MVGKTIEGTSLDLDIRRTSVITYRQRAYQKLGISRTNELVALLNDMHAERALASINWPAETEPLSKTPAERCPQA